ATSRSSFATSIRCCQRRAPVAASNACTVPVVSTTNSIPPPTTGAAASRRERLLPGIEAVQARAGAAARATWPGALAALPPAWGHSVLFCAGGSTIVIPASVGSALISALMRERIGWRLPTVGVLGLSLPPNTPQPARPSASRGSTTQRASAGVGRLEVLSIDRSLIIGYALLGARGCQCRCRCGYRCRRRVGGRQGRSAACRTHFGQRGIHIHDGVIAEQARQLARPRAERTRHALILGDFGEQRAGQLFLVLLEIGHADQFSGAAEPALP